MDKEEWDRATAEAIQKANLENRLANVERRQDQMDRTIKMILGGFIAATIWLFTAIGDTLKGMLFK